MSASGFNPAVGSQISEAELRARGLFRQALFLLILLAVWISTKPFTAAPEDGSVPAGDIVNQLTFSGLAVAAMLALLMVDRRALAPLLMPSYAILVLWLVVSVVTTTQSAISMRAFAFTIIVMFLAASLFALPERFRQFQTLMLAAALIVLALAYFGVIAMPSRGKHTDLDPFEPEHAGSWKGHFDHKNIAGAMMAVFAIMGVYALRVKRNWIGVALLLGGFIFLYFTKSKTSLALLPAVMLIVWMAERVPVLLVRMLLCLGPVLLLLALTLGGALYPEIATLNKAFMKDPTFTGRFDIWRYGFEMLAERPLFGYGFEAFWQTSTTLKGESRLELAWAVEKIIHGHNSYLDVMLTLGIPGIILVAYVFLIRPVIDYHRCRQSRDNQLLATMFLGMWMFISLGMCLETYYFRRADPVWFALLIAVIGLRFTAEYRIDQSPSQAAQAS
ncbi:MAG: O-antigen ligase family protein [Beijerinckiaceae bacterium]